MDATLFLQFVERATIRVDRVLDMVTKPGRVAFVANRCFRGEMQSQCMALELFVPLSIDESDSNALICQGGGYYRMLLNLEKAHQTLEWEVDPKKIAGNLVIDKNNSKETVVVREVVLISPFVATGTTVAPPYVSTLPSSLLKTISSVTVPSTLAGVPLAAAAATTTTTTIASYTSYSSSATSTGSSVTTTMTLPQAMKTYFALSAPLVAATATATATASTATICYNADATKTMLRFVTQGIVKIKQTIVDTSFGHLLLHPASALDTRLVSLYTVVLQDYSDQSMDAKTIVPNLLGKTSLYLTDMVKAFEETGFTFDLDRAYDRCVEVGNPKNNSWDEVLRDYENTMQVYNVGVYAVENVPLSLFAMLAIVLHMQDPVHQSYLPPVVNGYLKCVRDMLIRVMLAHIVQPKYDAITKMKADIESIFVLLCRTILNPLSPSDAVLTFEVCLNFEEKLINLLSKFNTSSSFGYTDLSFNVGPAATSTLSAEQKAIELYNCILGTEPDSVTMGFEPLPIVLWKELAQLQNIIAQRPSSIIDPNTKSIYDFEAMHTCDTGVPKVTELNIARFLEENFKDMFPKNSKVSEITAFYKQGQNIVYQLFTCLSGNTSVDSGQWKKILSHWVWVPFVMGIDATVQNKLKKENDYFFERFDQAVMGFLYSIKLIDKKLLGTIDGLYSNLINLMKRLLQNTIVTTRYKINDLNEFENQTLDHINRYKSVCIPRVKLDVDIQTFVNYFGIVLDNLKLRKLDLCMNTDVLMNDNLLQDVVIPIPNYIYRIPNALLLCGYSADASITIAVREIDFYHFYSLDTINSFMEIIVTKTQCFPDANVKTYTKEIPVILKLLCFCFFVGLDLTPIQTYYDAIYYEIKVYASISAVPKDDLKTTLNDLRNDYTRAFLSDVLQQYCLDPNKGYDASKRDTMIQCAEDVYHRGLLTLVPKHKAEMQKLSGQLIVRNGILERKVTKELT